MLVRLHLYHFTPIILPPVTALHQRSFISPIPTNTNLLAICHSSHYSHPVRPVNDIWQAQFIIAETVGTEVSGGDKQV
jgi:hypothetical protein